MMSFEWNFPETSTLVRQGDLLICRDPHKGVVEDICIVITADCDISNGKFGRQLACLRIIPLEEYLRTVWAIRKLNDLVNASTVQIQDRLNKWNSQRIGENSCLSSDAVISWVKRTKPENICSELNIPEKETKKVVAALSFFRTALEVLNDSPDSDKLRQLVAFRAAIKNEDIKKCWKETLQQALSEKLPEDVFMLISLPDLDIGPSVIMLREIIGVKLESVCYRTYDACTNEMFLRVARLEPVFKYSVSQAFGALYSKIGFPDDFEARRKKAINQLNDISWE